MAAADADGTGGIAELWFGITDCRVAEASPVISQRVRVPATTPLSCALGRRRRTSRPVSRALAPHSATERAQRGIGRLTCAFVVGQRWPLLARCGRSADQPRTSRGPP